MRLAIVIPTLDEERTLLPTLASARATLDLRSGDQLVVVDGGSTDRTIELARQEGVVVIQSEPGRGHQLNAGAKLALEGKAEALLFLHADTLLPAEARQSIGTALRQGAVGGGFTVRFEPSTALLRIGQRLVNTRARALSLPLGDQAQFVSAAAFRAAGGFPPWPILEDLELMLRLRHQGRRAVIEPAVITSARRFEKRGLLRTVFGNWLIWLLFLLGVSPHRLARLYRQVR